MTIRKRWMAAALALWATGAAAERGGRLNPLPESMEQRQKTSLANVALERGFDPSTGKMVLTIHYTAIPGTPFEKASSLTAWVRLNGQEGYFEMKREEQLSFTRFSLELSNVNFDCEPARSRGSDCERSTRAMQGLFFWAKREDPSSPNGKLNAWDIDLAFMTSEGAWDNNNGANFHLRFNE